MWDRCLETVTSNGTTSQVLTIQCVPILIDTIITAGLIFAGTVAVFFVIRAGYQYIMSNGDPKQAGTARQTLTYALIGLVIVFSCFFFLNVISTLTGTDCIKTIGFDACDKP